MLSSPTAQASELTGGLWGQYSFEIAPWKYEFEALEIENIDHANFDRSVRQKIQQLAKNFPKLPTILAQVENQP